MLRCPICRSEMQYKNGESKGRKYEFYGCIKYPYCRGTVEMDEVDEYDDGIPSERADRTIEEESNDLKSALLKEGYNSEEVSYAQHMWEKD